MLRRNFFSKRKGKKNIDGLSNAISFFMLILKVCLKCSGKLQPPTADKTISWGLMPSLEITHPFGKKYDPAISTRHEL